MSKKNFISSVLILVPFLVIAMATSNVTTTPVLKSYNVTSNCSNATLTSGTIVVQTSSAGSPIVSPPNTTYLNIGLPVASLSIGLESTISAEIAPALTRTCSYSTLVVGLTTNSIYTCADNFIPSCVVTLTPL